MGFDVLPCYVVCDFSRSMTDHLAAVDAGLREFRGTAHADRAVAARVRVCVIGFADEPRVLRPLCPAIELTGVAGPVLDGGSDFGAVFAFLRDTIDGDARELLARGLRLCRPLVFFISDGRPADPGWPSAFADLTDPARGTHPEVVAFGVGAADAVTLGRIGTSRLFLGRDGVRVGAALTASVVRASQGAIHDMSTSGPLASRTLPGVPEKAGEASR
ncbi:vWA domain-containing protein [Amycolatopsis albispora]|uniref:vWA domain-containing protein n=1 Tax=Amycolatopsis albispora TaxID=1804986 RepID=UPI000DE3BE9F|nr:hypothetical protein [Amycolatopsis albispora]